MSSSCRRCRPLSFSFLYFPLGNFLALSSLLLFNFPSGLSWTETFFIAWFLLHFMTFAFTAWLLFWIIVVTQLLLSYLASLTKITFIAFNLYLNKIIYLFRVNKYNFPNFYIKLVPDPRVARDYYYYYFFKGGLIVIIIL